jgi:hypothetical protein
MQLAMIVNGNLDEAKIIVSQLLNCSLSPLDERFLGSWMQAIDRRGEDWDPGEARIQFLTECLEVYSLIDNHQCDRSWQFTSYLLRED